MKNYKKSPGPVLALLILASCATAPRIAELPLGDTLPLNEGARAYVVIDVPAARPLLNQFGAGGFRKEDLARILDRTRYAVLALFPPDSGLRLQAAAWGNYPSFRARLALSGDRGWKTRRSPAGPFWYSADRDLALAFNSTQAFAALGTAEGGGPAGDAGPALRPVSASGPYTRGPGVPVPQGFGAFKEGACLALWMEDPAEPLGRFLEGMRLPIRIPAERFLAALVPLGSPEESGPPAPPAGGPPEPPAAGPGGAGPRYEIRLSITTPSEANARTLMTLFSTARLFLPRAAGADPEALRLLSLFFARPPELAGADLNLRTAPLDEGDLTLLLSLFSVYSRE